MGILAIALACLLAGPLSAQAKGKRRILGWTTKAHSLTPQKEDGETITKCPADGRGDRRLRYIFRGSGFRKNATLGMAISQDPEIFDLLDYGWPVGKDQRHTEGFGLTTDGSYFDGNWYATVYKGSRLLDTSHIFVDCL